MKIKPCAWQSATCGCCVTLKKSAVEGLEAQIDSLVNLSEKQSEKLVEALKAKNEQLFKRADDMEWFRAQLASLKAELAALQPRKPKYRVGQVLRLIKNGFGDPITHFVCYRVKRVEFKDGSYRYHHLEGAGFPESHWEPLSKEDL